MSGSELNGAVSRRRRRLGELILVPRKSATGSRLRESFRKHPLSLTSRLSWLNGASGTLVSCQTGEPKASPQRRNGLSVVSCLPARSGSVFGRGRGTAFSFSFLACHGGKRLRQKDQKQETSTRPLWKTSPGFWLSSRNTSSIPVRKRVRVAPFGSARRLWMATPQRARTKHESAGKASPRPRTRARSGVAEHRPL